MTVKNPKTNETLTVNNGYGARLLEHGWKLIQVAKEERKAKRAEPKDA